MRILVQAVLLVALGGNALARTPRTLLTVVTPDWKATTGELRRWRDDGDGWRQVGRAVPVVVGRSGLAWRDDKREGDGASPAGVMALGDATGYDAAPPPGTTLAYRRADDKLVCVDDPKNLFYNTVTPTPEPRTLASAEKMRRDDGEYRYTIFVRHNDGAVPGRGSCIFLHVWKDARTPTVGCTAMALDDMRTLLSWVTPATRLVQLPRAEYDKRQREWDLPPLGQRK